MSRPPLLPLLLLLLLTRAGVALAAGCVDGPVRSITVSAPSVDVAANSVPHLGHLPVITVTDGAGNKVPDVGLVITLPDAEPSGVFYPGGGKTVHIRTPYDCSPYLTIIPAVLVGAAPAAFPVRIAYDQDPSIAATVEYHVVAPPTSGLSMSLGSAGPTYAVPVGLGKRTSSLLGVTIAPATGGPELNVAGVPVTFTAPPAITFDDGTHVATVLTDPTGLAAFPPFVATGTPGQRFTVAISSPSLPSLSQDFVTVSPDTTISAKIVNVAGQQAFPATPHIDVQLDCGTAPRFLWITLNGDKWLQATPPQSSSSDCASTHAYSIDLAPLPFGYNEIQAIFPGDELHNPAQSNVIAIDVLPQASGSLATGGSWRAGAISHDADWYACPITRMSSVAAGANGAPQGPPPGQSALFGYFSYDVSGCVGLKTVRMVIELDSEIPQGATAWAYLSGSGNAAGTWKPLEAAIEGSRAQILLSTDEGDPGAGAGTLRGTLAIAAPQASGLMNVGGLWWGGASQSGWGMDLAQHGEQVVATLFMYGDRGRARWLVVPGGIWSDDHRTFSGSFYRPTYDATHAVMIPGNPVGDLRIVFSDAGHAILEYTIDGVTGTRPIERESFALPSAILRWNFSDLWWYGAQLAGKGIALVQQGDLLFSVTYGYDSVGNTTWTLMTDGYWVTPMSYRGKAYRSTGSIFTSATYDPSSVLVSLLPSEWGYDFSASSKLKASQFVGGYVVDTDVWYNSQSIPIEREPF